MVAPSTPQTTFQHFFEELKKGHPALFQRILSPSGTAKAASTSHLTPIKEIAGLRLAGLALPGDGQLYGWHALEKEAA